VKLHQNYREERQNALILRTPQEVLTLKAKEKKYCMIEIERISELLKHTFYQDAWHGPALLEVLKGVTARQAAKRPMADAHTIWELVLHSTTWIKAVDKTIIEMKYTQVTDAANWPVVTDKSESSWNKALGSLKKSHKKLEKHVHGLKNSALEKRAVNTSSPISRLLYGVVHHNIYHAGQIAILKKSK